jgi:hypothetical protein
MRADQIPAEIEQTGPGGVEEKVQGLATADPPFVGQLIGPDARGREIVGPGNEFLQFCHERNGLTGVGDEGASEERETGLAAGGELGLFGELRRPQPAQGKFVVAAENALGRGMRLPADRKRQ